ncbi:ABC transporter substrate-binding protein [Halalkalibacter akibai]|uniref:Rhamnose oligosaccharide ABC transport system n=1 Tax=Halalkalibacter akibai (strain ATCC 43226 / DSM 21942 / CIP 109018 / JCM 9157 / 1139) TaxID=1236973 RepID=W4QVR2_HALA3|nr:sugar ABC transporter substrate-binding protein [Halalkalibacter akibai]GAE36191.1 rhamnose oligosaccharide ABC transport system [Halalkalibacter akibai JCM 9157]
MKGKMTKWLMLAMFALVLALAGCSSQTNNDPGGSEEAPTDSADTTDDSAATGEDEVTIRVAWWGGQERHDMTLQAIDLFEAEYPHITVEPEYTGWDGYWERLNTQAAGNNLPDVINMDNSKLNEYNSRDLLVDLAPFIDAGTINLDDVDDVYQEINHDGDRVLAVSLGANSLATVFNRDLFEEHGIELEPGYTYGDLVDAMLKIKASADGEFYGFDFANAEYELFFSYARQNGQSVFNADGTGLGFEEGALVDFFTLVQDMVNEGAGPTHDITMSYIDGGNAMIGDGTAAVQMAASNQIIGLSQSTDYELGLNLLPSLEGGQHGNWIRPSMSFAISQHSKQQEAAALFIDFFTNSLEAHELLKADRGVPISSKVREHLAPLVDGPVQETFEFLELVAEYTSPADPLSPPGESEVRGSFLRIVETLKYDRITPEEAAKQFIQEAEAVLN